MDTSRAWAEIDLDALTRNLAEIRRRIGVTPAILLVAKANAYGHGATVVARHALRHGAAAIGVNNCGEAFELRKAGIRARIVVLGAVVREESGEALRCGAELTVPSREARTVIEEVARRSGLLARVHLMVDTGMNQLGAPVEHALPLLKSIRHSPYLQLAGVATHLTHAGGANTDSGREQLRRFREFLVRARRRGLLRGGDSWIHVANSAGIFTGLDPLFDAVRPGISAYGIAPAPETGCGELDPLLSLRARVVHLREIAAGERVGYEGTWCAPRPSRIATLPLGYADGIDWRLGNRGHVLLQGHRAPIVGRISMDYTTVDVTEIGGVALGETATFVGQDGTERIRVEEIARLIGTIPYEITCSLGRRVQRIFRGEREEHEDPGKTGQKRVQAPTSPSVVSK